MSGTPAVAYFRMSTDSQEASIPAQMVWALKAAEREGVRLVAEFQDPGIAGGEVEHRPGLQAMLDYCEREFQKSSPVEAVLVWDPDRLSRASSLKTSAVLSRLQDAGVCRLLTCSDGWVDLEDCTHRVLYLIKQDLARAGFCEGLARNVLRGKQARAAAGYWTGGPAPFGYLLEGHRLTPDPAAAAVVRWLFEAYASGAYSMADLQAELLRRGVKPPRSKDPSGTWGKTTIRNVFRNRVYLGHTVWNLRHAGKYARLEKGAVVKDDTARLREQDRRRRKLRKMPVRFNDGESVFEVPHTHEALTDEKTFEAVRQRVERNRRRTTPVRGGGIWILTGLLRCGGCGAPMHGVTAGGRKGEVLRYYACSKAKSKRACPVTKKVRQDVLVNEVVETIRERFADGPALAALRAEVARLAGQGQADLKAEQERLRAQLVELQKNIDQGNRNLALLPSDMLTGVVAQIRQWEKDREKTTLELDRLSLATEAREDLTGKVEAAVKQLRRLHRRIEKASPAEARAALSGVVESVTVNFRQAKSTQDMEVTSIDVQMADALVKLFTTS